MEETRTVHGIFESCVDRAPLATAIVEGETRFSYEQLNCAANGIARALLQRGLQLEQRVGIYAERSIEYVAAMIGVLKAGGAYVPLDPGYPHERVSLMVEDASLAAIVTLSGLKGRLGVLNVPIVLADEQIGSRDSNPAVPGVGTESLIYVMYTSGSSGRPKGVMIEHRGVIRLVVNTAYAPIAEDDRVAHCASPSFDGATWEVWTALLNGACLVIVSREVVLDPVRLNQLLLRHSVTALFLTTGLFHEYVEFLEESFAGLRYLKVGGDAMKPRIVASVLRKTRRPKHLINGYGPTEATACATTFEIIETPEDGRPIPIGRPIAETDIYILDEARAPVALGEVGEIYIGGSGVARGYLNDPRATQDRFILHEVSTGLLARLYRTGDLGRFRGDGDIEFCGRCDLQLKIRGFRVEPGEIEVALQSHPDVQQAVVLGQDDELGEKRLYAYVVREQTGSGDPLLDIDQLYENLKSRLPGHMIPTAIIQMERMPLTPNGKVDRTQLPVSARSRFLRRPYVAPVTPIEAALCGIWARAMSLQQIGALDNFFELGGDSLMSLRLATLIAEELNIVGLPTIVLLEYQTVRDLAHYLEGSPCEG